MRGLLQFLGGVLAASIAGLIVVAFQAPIARQFSIDRPYAEISAEEWLPLPPEAGALGADLPFGDYAKDQVARGEPIHFATVRVHNRGSKRIENARLTFKHAPELVVVTGEGVKPVVQQDPSSVTLPTLLPGQVITLRIWSVFGLDDKLDWDASYVSSTSSEGPFTFVLRVSNLDVVEDPIINFMDTILLPVLYFLLCVVCIFSIPIAYHFTNLTERLLKDPLLYRKESKRYRDDPKKYDYNPDRKT